MYVHVGGEGMQLSIIAANRHGVHWDTDPLLSAGPCGELVGRGMWSDFSLRAFLNCPDCFMFPSAGCRGAAAFAP